MSDDDGTVTFERDGMVAHVTFNRPHARNAMTWKMYDELFEHLQTINGDDDIRVAVFRGAGGEAFVAGTDIRQFLEFETGDDGLAYNAKVEPMFMGIERVNVPTIAVVDGFAVGGGLFMAAMCDLRIVTDDSRFGVPVARTLGNMPAMNSLSRLVALIGPARTKEMIFTARLWDAQEALAAGLVTEVHPRDDLDARVDELVGVISRRAPLTMSGVKEAVRRIVDATTPTGEDLIRRVYGSQDFKEGRAAFVEKRTAEWQNR